MTNLTTLRNVKLFLRMNVLPSATGTLTFGTLQAVDPFTIGTVTFLADANYDIGDTPTETAINAKAAIDADLVLREIVDVTVDVEVLTVTARMEGVIGNQIDLVGCARIVASGSTLEGGEGTLTDTETTTDEELLKLIEVSSEDVSNYLGYDPTYREVEIVFSASERLWSYCLPDLPNLAVSEVTINDVSLTEWSKAISTNAWFVEGSILRFIGFEYSSFYTYEIVFTQGYSVMPAPIVQAATEQVAQAWRNRDHLGQQVKTLDAQSTTFFDRGLILPSVERMLRPYRRVY
jgi:hypothetical protein